VKKFPVMSWPSGSWICTSPSREVREFYTEANARKAFEAGWRVQLAHEYLREYNARVKREFIGSEPPFKPRAKAKRTRK
jgi:hypothetical protein